MSMDAVTILMTIIFPLLGSVLGYILMVSPVKAVREAEANMKLGQLNPLPSAVFLINSFGWTMYGSAIKDPWIFFANVFGIPINMYMVLKMYALADTQTRSYMERVILGSSVILMTSAAVFLFDSDYAAACQFSGTLASMFNISVYMSPLSTMGKVIKTRNSASLLPAWIVASLGCSLTWTLYSATLRIYPVLTCSLIGVASSVAQLILRGIFPALKPAAVMDAGGSGGYHATVEMRSAPTATVAGNLSKSKTPINESGVDPRPLRLAHHTTSELSEAAYDDSV